MPITGNHMIDAVGGRTPADAQEITCPECNGTNHGDPCPSCLGAKVDGEGQTCETCGGDGFDECNVCHGACVVDPSTIEPDQGEYEEREPED